MRRCIDRQNLRRVAMLAGCCLGLLVARNHAAEAPEPPTRPTAVEAEASVVDKMPSAPPAPSAPSAPSAPWDAPWSSWTGRQQLPGTLRTVGLLTLFSVAPSVLLMTTSFIRISVVLGLLRQALGASTLPSQQVMMSLSLLLTALVMLPVWTEVYTSAVSPYSQPTDGISAREAWERGVRPVRAFMIRQIQLADNGEDVLLFYDALPAYGTPPSNYEEVPLQILLPAFMLSELKIAFLIGFQIFLPFLVIDLVVSSVSVGVGMVMLPPSLVSLPLKLLLFVLVDGWHLVIGMLLRSFVPGS